jgi:putative membrane protein
MTQKDNNDLAEERTHWAEDRTILANERTFAGWMRTGMAALGVALGLKAVFKNLEPTWLAQTAATIFVITAIIIFWAARSSSIDTSDRMNEHDANSQSTKRMTLLATILTVGALATGIILWML